MTGNVHRSFRLSRCRCPRCGRAAGAVEWRRASNWVRIPLAAIAAMVLCPLVRIWMTCQECGQTFLAFGAQ